MLPTGVGGPAVVGRPPPEPAAGAPAGEGGGAPLLLPVRVRPHSQSSRAPRAGGSPVAEAGGEAVVAHVLLGEDVLVCYLPLGEAGGPPAVVAEGGPGDTEVVLRVPLCLTTLSEIGDTAISITMPTPAELREKLRGTRKAGRALLGAPGGGALGGGGAPDEPSGWTLECGSPGAAAGLLGRLRAAGGVLAGGLQRRYELIEAISDGDHGRVFRAVDQRSREQVCVKLFTNDRDPNLTHPLLEANILRCHRHPNIEEFREVYAVRDPLILTRVRGANDHDMHPSYAIVSEFLLGGIDLFEHVQGSGRLPEERVRNVMRQLLSALCCLHSQGIVHRDVKLENIILTGNNDEVKLTGFGLSASEKDNEALRARVGAPGYVAPEVIESPLNCKADCFSSGAVMFALLSGRMPFPGKDMGEVLLRNVFCKVDTSALDGVSDGATEVVLGLLCKSPCGRLTAAGALQRPWFGPAAAGSDGGPGAPS